jgi:hypothetical protein
MKSAFLYASSVATLASFSFAFAEPIGPNDDSFCGTVNISYEQGLPIVESIQTYITSHPQVEKVIAKYGRHSIGFSFADGAHVYRTGGEAIAALNETGGPYVCAIGEVVEVSQWGTPTVISPKGILTYPFDNIPE